MAIGASPNTKFSITPLGIQIVALNNDFFLEGKRIFFVSDKREG